MLKNLFRTPWDLPRLFATLLLGGSMALLFGHLVAPKVVPSFLRMGIPRKTMTILVVGADINYSAENHARQWTRSRADTIMILQIQPARPGIQILSIPRDTFISIPEYGMNKINAAFAFGGRKLLTQVIEDFTGLTIDRFLILQPDSVKRIIDKMGGVRVFVDKKMDYDDYWGNLHVHLKPGWQWLSGEKLQGYLRFRHDPTGDIRRIERQQDFMEQLSSGSFRPRSIFFLPRTLRAIPEITHTNLRIRELITLGNFARMVPSGSFKRHIVPGGTGQAEGMSVWLANHRETQKIIEQYFLNIHKRS